MDVDPTTAFFDQLGRRGHEPGLQDAKGTIRFDLRDEDGTDQWYLVIDNGDVRVSRDNLPADCVLHTDRDVFDRMVTGQLHQLPAWLRHMIWVEGDPRLSHIFGNALPGPPGARHPREVAGGVHRRPVTEDGTARPDPATEFFEQLGRRGHEPLLQEVTGTIRFDLRDEHGIDYWFVEMDNGDVRVSREVRPAECVIHIDRAVFNLFATGQMRSQVAWLRRLFWVEGNALLMRLFDRALPGHPQARHPRTAVAESRGRR